MIKKVVHKVQLFLWNNVTILGELCFNNNKAKERGMTNASG